ncbi:MAG: bifunctional enoyl-CoA hydratase/phosphate acetyltransferase [Alphaproteobacteria bacterium]|nr:bifunctional enoyl-CoA hydratase/phosphate acetyltransferase [Alphaproteobacteria bacterium]
MLSKIPFEFPPYLAKRASGLSPLPMAVVGAGHPLVMDSARRATEGGFIEPVLVGEADGINEITRQIGWDISGIRLVPADGERQAAETAASLARGGEVAALMKGHIHTDTLMRAILTRSAGLRTDRRVSHIFHMTLPGRDRVIHITDAAVNVQPGVAEKLDIVLNAVELAQSLGMESPKVAMLSGAETVNPAMPSSVEADEVVRLANNGAVKGAIVDGPFGFDNAVSPEAALIKGVDSPVAGQADILVVPNLEAGNFLFKQMVYFMSATAAGIVMGAKVPVVLTSRADPSEARLAAAAIASIIGER